jgi:hypothetical protein
MTESITVSEQIFLSTQYMHNTTQWYIYLYCETEAALTCLAGEEDGGRKVRICIVPRSGVARSAEQFQYKTNERRKNGQSSSNTEQCWNVRSQDHQVWK